MKISLSVFVKYMAFAVALLGVLIAIYFQASTKHIKQSERELIPRAVDADLTEIAHSVVAYRKSNGVFPKKLDVISQHDLNLVDWFSLNTSCNRLYGYSVTEDNSGFTISSIGPDKQADTNDDITVAMDTNGNSRPGATYSYREHPENGCVSSSQLRKPD